MMRIEHQHTSVRRDCMLARPEQRAMLKTQKTRVSQSHFGTKLVMWGPPTSPPHDGI